MWLEVYEFSDKYNNGGCSQWYIQFGGQDCTQPARVTTSIHTDHSDGDGSLTRNSAEVGDVCNTTSTGNCHLETFRDQFM